MKISLRWLRDYISFSYAPNELAAKLTALGIEVEGIEDFSAKFEKVIVGQVLEVADHPNADTLHLTKVSIGSGDPLKIVCGAPNVRQGQKVAVALIGADLGEGLVIKKSKIRGEVSEGMLCSERELGLSESHEGILELPADSEVGMSLAQALGKDDVIFEVGLTPNRADCLSHIGIAREVAVLTGGEIKKPEIHTAFLDRSNVKASDVATVTINDPLLCPRYAARVVRGVTVAESPAWLKEKLEAIGLRPRNNIVDITNFVLMECGHPLHAFDFGKVNDAHIIVRRADGFAKKFTTLDSKERALDPETLLIADAVKPLAIAGIMGGENSEITATTTDVLIESAFFNPTSIRRSAKRLGLSTDASHRFERGTDIENVIYAVNRAAALMGEFADGEVLSGIIDEYPHQQVPTVFSFRPERASLLLGEEIAASRMEPIFSSLHIGVNKSSDNWQLTSPSWRVDLEQEVDAIEEIARVIGYDSLPVSDEDAIPLMRERDMLPKRKFDEMIRTGLVALGFSECLSTPMLPHKQAEMFHTNPVEVMNPLTVELERMRPSVLPNLLDIARRNERFGATGQRLFEVGNVFHYADSEQLVGRVNERTEIALVIKDTMEEKNAYNAKEQKADIYLIRGVIEAFLRRLGITFTVTIEPNKKPYFEPDETITFTNGKKVIGKAGRIHTVLLQEYDLRSVAYGSVLDYGTLHELAKSRITNPPPVEPLPKFPSVERDIALILPSHIPALMLIESAQKSIPSQILENIRIFDEFESKEMKAAAERSLGIRITLRSNDRTLEDEEVTTIIHNVVEFLQKEYSARLRA